jgi:type II secretory pathway component PulF
MQHFTFSITDAFGNRKRAELSAETPQEALAVLRNEGYRATLKDLVAVRQENWLSRLKSIDFAARFSQVPKKDIYRLIKMLGSSFNRGRTLKDSLEFIGENEDSKALRNVIHGLQERMEKPFTSQVEIFGLFPQYFDEEFLGVIQAGESSSNLGTYLVDYVEEKKKQMALTAKFHSVLMARGFTFLMVCAVALVVVVFVIPQFKQLFGSKLQIPWAMNTLLSLSNFLKHFGPYIAVLLTLGIVTFYYLGTNHAGFRHWWHDTLLHLPVLGKTLRTYYTAHFAYLLSTLLTKNVDILKAMQIIVRQTPNVCMQETYRNLIAAMQGGEGLFAAIIKENEAGRDYLIPSIVQAAKVGGATASLGSTLSEVRTDLDELFVIRLERTIRQFSAIFYVFILGCAVFIAYAIGGAIIAFYENAQKLI